MANFGKVYLRKDSITNQQGRAQSRKPAFHEVPPLATYVPPRGPTLSCTSPVSRISFEEGQRILQQAARRRSEPSPIEIVQAIEVINTEQRDKQEEKDEAFASPTDIDKIIEAYAQTALNGNTTQATVATTSTGAYYSRRDKGISRVTSTRRERLSRRLTRTLTSITSPHPRSASVHTFMRPVSLLVASLGNPPPYQSTRHSAGHIILAYLSRSLSLQPVKSKLYANGLVALGSEAGRPEISIWQCPSLMNVSGPALLKAWKQFVNSQEADMRDPITGLVVLHDEMELEPGRLKIRRGEGSAKGHNGIKSVQASLSSAGLLSKLDDRFIKIGVGIGRPAGGTREKGDVSAYVLGQLTSREKDGLETTAREVENVLYQEIARIGRSAS